ncbi:MAG: hypothetical protein IH908_07130 [Proteobacteria bacterium]|nr:hypothetical protein [Pseudomonadota bacterium]
MTKENKVAFASPAWIEIARGVLEDLVSEHGKEGQAFSICESFAEAPSEIADDDGFAAWHFYIDGKSVRVGQGRVDDTDAQIQATWELVLPVARLVYTPELLADWAKNPPERPKDPNASQTGDMTKMPPYLLELHNHMAKVTE